MIYMVLDGLPPSSNHAYFNNPRGGRTLTTKGQAYLAETKMTLARTYREAMTFFNKKDAPYFLLVRFHLAALENKGFAKGTAETRYKHIDVGNRLKLLEDALKDAAGVDDSQNLIVMLQKVQSDDKGPNDKEFTEATEIFVWNLEEEKTPFDDVLRALYSGNVQQH